MYGEFSGKGYSKTLSDGCFLVYKSASWQAYKSVSAIFIAC